MFSQLVRIRISDSIESWTREISSNPKSFAEEFLEQPENSSRDPSIAEPNLEKLFEPSLNDLNLKIIRASREIDGKVPRKQDEDESFILGKAFPPNLSSNSFFIAACTNREVLTHIKKLDLNVSASFRIQKLPLVFRLFKCKFKFPLGERIFRFFFRSFVSSFYSLKCFRSSYEAGREVFSCFPFTFVLLKYLLHNTERTCVNDFWCLCLIHQIKGTSLSWRVFELENSSRSLSECWWSFQVQSTPLPSILFIKAMLNALKQAQRKPSKPFIKFKWLINALLPLPLPFYDLQKPHKRKTLKS